MDPYISFQPYGDEATYYEHTRFVFRCFLCQESMRRNVSRYRSKFELVNHNNQNWTQNAPGNSTSEPSGKVVAFYHYQNDKHILDARCLGTFGPEDTLLTTNRTYIKIPTGDSKPQYIVTCLSLQEPEDFCGACDSRHNARIFLAHEHCWALTQSPSPIPLPQLAIFAHQTRVIMPSVNPSDSEPAFRPSPDLLASLNTDNGLGGIFKRISGLPQELVDMVMDNMKGTKVLSMLRTKDTLLYLFPRLRLGYSLNHPSYITPVINAPLTGLYARETELLGQTYLSELGFNKTEDVLTVSLEKKPIRGVQFYASSLGIRRVRILYTDKSSSAWLGRWSPHSGWVGTVLGDDLNALRVLSDNLRILRVFFGTLVEDAIWKEPEQSSRVSYYRSVLWPSGQTMPSDGQVVYCCEKPNERLLSTAPHYPGWRLCEMLSLDEPYMTGLTFHFSELGISGIEAHFAEGNRMVGSEAEYSLHLALCEGEYLTSAWQFQKQPLVSVNAAWDFHQPGYNDRTMISVTTSRGRTQHFGTANIREAEVSGRETEEYDSWTCLTPTSSTKITGFVVDKLETHPRPPFNDIGVVVEKDFVPPPTRATLTPDSLSIEKPWIWTTAMNVEEEFGDSEHGFFFVTTASLKNVARILVQGYDEKPVMGMQVIHHDGTTETLGPHWSAKVQDCNAIREIYKSTDGHLDILRFVDRQGREGEGFAYIEVETSDPDEADHDALHRFESRGWGYDPSIKCLEPIADNQVLGWAFGTCFPEDGPQSRKVEWQKVFVYKPEIEDIQLPIRPDELEVLV